jgi:hypothetical protein
MRKNKSDATAAGGRPVMQNFKTEPTDMEHFPGDKTEAPALWAGNCSSRFAGARLAARAIGRGGFDGQP